MVSSPHDPNYPFPSRGEATRRRLREQGQAQEVDKKAAPSAPTPPSSAPTRTSVRATGAAPARTSTQAKDAAPSRMSTQQTTAPQRKSVMQRSEPEDTFSDVIAPKARVKEKEKKPRSLAKRISLGLVYTFITLGILGTGLFIYLYYTLDIPEADEVALAQTTTVYYADGTTRMGTYSEVNRTIIDTSTVPKYVGHAIVASEDRTFYTNSGVDLKGILRALYNNVTTGSRQGGSTLTQQYVERYYVGETTSYMGKLKEAILALKINRQQTKDQILGNYMNTIYFGRGAYGIEAAAKVYFGKHASELTLSEAAMLSGIIPAPSAWDPALDEEQAKARWKRVLDLMVQDGWITQAEASKQVFPTTLPLDELGAQDFAGPQGYLLAHIRRELQNSGNFTDEQIETGGLKIISTIDKTKFDAMVAAAHSMTEVEGWKPEAMHVAMTSIDPTNGEIVAEYGGPDYLKRQQNAATQDISPAASTFKTFTLLGHIRNGGSVYDTFNGNSPQTFDGLAERVVNDGGYSYGRVNLIRATEYSINTAFVEVNEKIGAATTKQIAVEAGIPEDTLGLDDTLLNTLGFAAPRNIDLARAYATLAAGGEKRTPHIVREVQDAAGNVVYRAINESERVFSEQEVSDILPALEAVVSYDGTADKVSDMKIKAAGKTGTASDQKSAVFVGFTPQLSTAVTMYQSDDKGNPVPLDNIGGLDQFHGGDWPVDVWVKYMTSVGQSTPNTDFPWRVKPRQSQTPVQVEQPQSAPTQPTQPQNTTPEVVESPGVVVPTPETPPETPPTGQTPPGDGGTTPGTTPSQPTVPGGESQPPQPVPAPAP